MTDNPQPECVPLDTFKDRLKDACASIPEFTSEANAIARALDLDSWEAIVEWDNTERWIRFTYGGEWRITLQRIQKEK